MSLDCKRFVFYYQAALNFIAKSMVEINPPSFEWPRSEMKVFNYHTYGDQKHLVATWLAKKCFQLSFMWWWRTFSHCRIVNQKFSIATWMAIENILLPQDKWSNSNHRIIGNRISVITQLVIEKNWLP